MCGILGCVGEIDFDLESFSMANNLMSHRGPDDSGVWKNENNEVIFGHRRLSILELSSKGSQPMQSRSNRFVISYNGEIYNHLEIREKLEREFSFLSNSWKGNSDTETILACLDSYGIKKTLNLLTGMFSFAVWDKFDNKLYLTRDRIGEKPLYLSFLKGRLYFSSELKAIKFLSKEKLKISADSLGLFFKYSYIPFPYSIYENTFKLEPGTFLEITPQQIKNLSFPIKFKDLKEKEIIKHYWKLEDVLTTSSQNLFKTKEEAIYEIEKGLTKAVKSQLISDVPLGAFLSGGIDSSLITALMQNNSTNKVKTFTIGFEEKEFDESIYAKRIASVLGTDHTEHVISMDEALKIIPDLPNIYDEPFSDSSQIPTILVSAITKKDVTVALSGDGGDEFFGGYNRHFRVPKIHSYFSKIPRKYLKPLGQTIKKLNKIAPSLSNFFVSLILRTPSFQVGDKIEKLVYRLDQAHSLIDLYRSFVTEWNETSELVLNSKEKHSFLNLENKWPSFSSFEEKMMYLDAKTYLPDDIMVKVDRASMSQSLETRAPFLDKNVIELSSRTPLSYKIQGGNGKLILKDILSKYVDPKYFLRPKQGFGVPLSQWLRGPLRETFEDITSQALIRDQGFLNYEMVRKKWKEHLNGTHNWSHALWSILMFQLWLDKHSN